MWRGLYWLILSVVFGMSCLGQPDSNATEHPCERSAHCVYDSENGESNCESGYTWEDPEDSNNYNCVSDDNCVPTTCSQAEVTCDDIRSEVLSAPSTPGQALCDYPDRVCEFSIYAACYSDQCRNRCSFLERFACIDGVPIQENKEGIVCNFYEPGNCEGFYNGNVCDVQGQICIESPECATDLCAPDCLATLCIDGSWAEVPRREYASDCQ